MAHVIRSVNDLIHGLLDLRDELEAKEQADIAVKVLAQTPLTYRIGQRFLVEDNHGGESEYMSIRPRWERHVGMVALDTGVTWTDLKEVKDWDAITTDEIARMVGHYRWRLKP